MSIFRSTGAMALCLALTGCIIATAPPAEAPVPPPPPPAPEVQPVSIELGYFYDSMDPYGDWIWMAPHGWVWAPAAVDPFWRPYTVGRWAWSDYGWTWVSDEPFGWAAYHYGRWTRAPRHGWVWIPGDVWGPAWVAWRQGPGVVGWAPLPPGVHYNVNAGLDFGGVDINVAIRSDWWCFVDDVYIVEPAHRHLYPVGRNITVIARTSPNARIHHNNGRIFNDGYPRERAEHATRRPLPRYRVVDRDDDHDGRDVVRGNEVHVWRPKVHENNGRQDPPRRAFGRPQDNPAHAREAAPEPPPLPQAPPPVEKKIERHWENDWQRLLESRKEEARRKQEAAHAREAPAAPAPPPPAQKIERERDENAAAAENAYNEQQAERARAQREAEKPRPPAKGPMGPKHKQGKGKGQGHPPGQGQGQGKDKQNDDESKDKP